MGLRKQWILSGYKGNKSKKLNVDVEQTTTAHLDAEGENKELDDLTDNVFTARNMTVSYTFGLLDADFEEHYKI